MASADFPVKTARKRGPFVFLRPTRRGATPEKLDGPHAPIVTPGRGGCLESCHCEGDCSPEAIQGHLFGTVPGSPACAQLKRRFGEGRPRPYGARDDDIENRKSEGDRPLSTFIDLGQSKITTHVAKFGLVSVSRKSGNRFSVRKRAKQRISNSAAGTGGGLLSREENHDD